MSIRRINRKISKFYIGTQQNIQDESSLIYNIQIENDETIYPRPTMNLNADNTYVFIINSPGNPFYITSDVEGGKDSLHGMIHIESEEGSSGNVGIENGVLIWTPTIFHADMNIYYQSDKCKNMGSKITIII